MDIYILAPFCIRMALRLNFFVVYRKLYNFNGDCHLLVDISGMGLCIIDQHVEVPMFVCKEGMQALVVDEVVFNHYVV